MITDPIALLRDAENYLSALHGSVARHDHLAANLACAGCELRDRIAAALPELAAVSSAVVAPPTDQTAHRDRRERYANAIHDAMETDLSLVDQEPAYQALIARAAEAAEALADAEQNRQFLTTLANLGIAAHRLDRIRDAARLHRQQLLGTSELYAVIEADDRAADAPAAECSAQHRQFDEGRLCIRAAQHHGDHIDERGYHWSDTVAVYPVADGTFRTGTNVRAELRRLADETATTQTQPASTAPLAAGLPLVKGNCPACGGSSLFLGNGGYVTCSRIDCPEPDAASTTLEQPAAGARQDGAQP